MMIYGPSLESLASQRNFYDSLYGSANKANADALTRSNDQQTTLDQLPGAYDRQRADTLQRQGFEAQQNAQQQGFLAQQNLQRQGFEAQQNAQQQRAALYGDLLKGDVQNRRQDQRDDDADFRAVMQSAQGGAYEPDVAKLKQLFPHFDDSKINAIYQATGAARVGIVQQGIANAAKVQQPPDPALLASAGVPEGSPWASQAQAAIKIARAPYEQMFTKTSGDVTDASNVQRLQSAQAALTPAAPDSPPPASGIPTGTLPTGQQAYSPQWWNTAATAMAPVEWAANELFPSVPPDSVVQPTGAGVPPQAVAARMAAYSQQFKDPDSMVTTNTGGPGFTSTVPRNWAPLISAPTPSAPPAAAPSTGTAPASGPSAPKIITDKQGRKWLYKGSLPDPTLDKNKANWQRVQ